MGNNFYGSGQKLFKYPRVMGDTGNVVYLVQVGSTRSIPSLGAKTFVSSDDPEKKISLYIGK